MWDKHFAGMCLNVALFAALAHDESWMENERCVCVYIQICHNLEGNLNKWLCQRHIYNIHICMSSILFIPLTLSWGWLYRLFHPLICWLSVAAFASKANRNQWKIQYSLLANENSDFALLRRLVLIYQGALLKQGCRCNNFSFFFTKKIFHRKVLFSIYNN